MKEHSVLETFDALATRSQEQLIVDLEDLPLTMCACSAQMYSFSYWTKGSTGRKELASASLTIPRAIDRPIPLLSYQHGTETLRDEVTSVRGFKTSNDGFVAGICAASGYATVVPDYLGLGISKSLHPYLHADTLAHAVQDALAAASQICKELDILLDNSIYLIGYSEGGHATMAAHRLLEENGITVTASAPLGGPYDLSGTMLDIMLNRRPYPAPAYAPYILLAYNNAYGLFSSPEHAFRKPYDETLAVLFDGSHSRDEIERELPEMPIDILREEVIDAITKDTSNAVRKALYDNDVYRWQPKAPIRLCHCPDDATVPFANSKVALDYFLQNGATNVELVSVDGDSHAEAALPCIIEGLHFFEQFLGQEEELHV